MADVAGFGKAVRQFRIDARLSLDELAVRSGVSRAALSKIERGESNPGLQQALGVADGLGVPLSDLVGQYPQLPVIVRNEDVTSVVDEETGATRDALLSPQPGAELVRYRLPAHAVLEPFTAHEPGTRETFLVLDGGLRIRTSGHDLILHCGDAATLPAHDEHELSNPTPEETVALLLILRPS
ncbi:helix-turn-helix domain-containing protein [Sciscionella marina]|uniref:helix-turn-helix domain-containing protein n=1 Tax=Sciscionella marina TaxID=508770 RepID=UPI0003816BE4|nr:XRE family transcriptional regulator [Sciscionella marina]